MAFVVAEDRYTAADAAELVEVEYEELPVLVDPHKATDPSSPILREDREEKSNHIFHWEVGDKAATDKAFQDAAVKANVHAVFQRCHPAPLETCGCVADFNRATGRLTIYMTSQAPHAHRTLFALVGGIPENNIRVISPDIGGGFGNKVPIYPGYVCAVVASLDAGPSGEMDRDAFGESPVHRFCARLPHDRRTGRRQGRQDPGDAGEDAG